MSTLQRAITAAKAVEFHVVGDLDAYRAGTRFCSDLRDGKSVDTSAEAIATRDMWLTYIRSIIHLDETPENSAEHIARAMNTLKVLRAFAQDELDAYHDGIRSCSEIRDGKRVDITAETTKIREVWLAYLRANVNAFQEHPDA